MAGMKGAVGMAFPLHAADREALVLWGKTRWFAAKNPMPVLPPIPEGATEQACMECGVPLAVGPKVRAMCGAHVACPRCVISLMAMGAISTDSIKIADMTGMEEEDGQTNPAPGVH